MWPYPPPGCDASAHALCKRPPALQGSPRWLPRPRALGPYPARSPALQPPPSGHQQPLAARGGEAGPAAARARAQDVVSHAVNQRGSAAAAAAAGPAAPAAVAAARACGLRPRLLREHGDDLLTGRAGARARLHNVRCVALRASSGAARAADLCAAAMALRATGGVRTMAGNKLRACRWRPCWCDSLYRPGLPEVLMQCLLTSLVLGHAALVLLARQAPWP